MPLPYCFNYYSFVIKFEIRKCDTCTSTLSQNCFGYLGSLVDPYTFKFVFSISVKNTIGILIGITLNLQMTLGSTFMMFLFLQTILLFLQYPWTESNIICIFLKEIKSYPVCIIETASGGCVALFVGLHSHFLKSAVSSVYLLCGNPTPVFKPLDLILP